MTATPWGWRRLSRRLTAILTPEQARTTLGDLLEDYRTDRARTGSLLASWNTWRDARSLARAYAPPPQAGWTDALLHDARAAIRTSIRQPGLTLTIIVVLAFALSVNTALSSIVDGLLFRPLPFRDTDALVQIRLAPSSQVDRKYSEFIGLIERVGTSPLFAGVSMARSSDDFAADAATEAGVRASKVSPGFANLMGMRLTAGRDFTVEDSRAPDPHVIVDAEVWQQLLANDPNGLERSVMLAGRRVRVVGVTPVDTSYPLATNVWVATGPPNQSDGLMIWPLARLAPGVTVDQVKHQYPDLQVTPLREAIQPAETRALLLLLAATLVLLLTACIQVGSLLMARTVGRLTETTIKVALGISPSRLSRQHFLDAAALAVSGLVLAWLAAPLVTRAIAAQLPPAVTRGQAIAPDGRTLAYMLLAGLATMALLALAPWSLTRRVSRETTPMSSTSAVRLKVARWREGLLAGQVACSALLLCVSGLALHSFIRVSRLDPGFDPRALWQISVPSLPAGLSSDERTSARVARMAEIETVRASLLAAPEVAAAGSSATTPISPAARFVIYLPGIQTPLPVEPQAHMVTPEYLATLGVRLLSGRMPRVDRSPEEPEEFIVNRAFAQQWPNAGTMMTTDLRLAGRRGRIVGVIEDFSAARPGAQDYPRIFVGLGRSTPSILLLRARSDDEAVRTTIAAIVARTWPDTSTSRVTRVQEEFDRIAQPWRARTILFGIVAGLCVPLVITGLTGMLYMSVRHRWRELAIQLALGATRKTVYQSVLLKAWRPVVLGLMIGLGAGAATGKAMSGLLFGIEATDPSTLIGVGLALFVVATVAASWPARLASSISPVEALKER